MEFGIFSQMHVPPGEDEHSRFLREVDVAIATDAAGFKYNWAPEHHFLENYSHQPAPEVFLSFIAARAPRIHVGHAIVNITAASRTVLRRPSRSARVPAPKAPTSAPRVTQLVMTSIMKVLTLKVCSIPSSAPEMTPSS